MGLPPDKSSQGLGFNAFMPFSNAATHCVIVDDHQMLLHLLAGAVSGIPGLVVSATATDLSEAERLAALDRIDLLIVDRQLRTGDGVDVVRTVHARHPDVKCIVIAGVTADFICPPDLLDVIVSVVDKTHACETLLSEIERVVEVPRDDAEGQGPEASIRSRLTVREWQLFLALGDGLSNKELGTRFGISTRTVETHRKAIAKKLGVSGAALVRLAVLQHRSAARLPLPQAPSENATEAGGPDA